MVYKHYEKCIYKGENTKKNIVVIVYFFNFSNEILNRDKNVIHATLLMKTRRGSPTDCRPFPMQLHQYAKSPH